MLTVFHLMLHVFHYQLRIIVDVYNMDFTLLINWLVSRSVLLSLKNEQSLSIITDIHHFVIQVIIQPISIKLLLLYNMFKKHSQYPDVYYITLLSNIMTLYCLVHKVRQPALMEQCPSIRSPVGDKVMMKSSTGKD